MLSKRSVIAVAGLIGMIGSSNAFSHGFDDSCEEARDPSPSQVIGLDTLRSTARLQQSRELFGRSNFGSIQQGTVALDGYVHQWVKKRLAPKWKSLSDQISECVIQESIHYRFDPVFLLAVIENESSFNPVAIGPVGEIGLMQITPDTARWLMKLYPSLCGKINLKDPVKNIQLGAAYLAYLREKFEFKGQLYLAAYNMGSGNVLKLLDKRVMPKVYSSRVMLRYRRYYSELKKETQSVGHRRVALISGHPSS